MQACYVNTTHPDFLNGHKAMSLVSDRMAAARPAEKVDPKKISSAALNNGRDLESDIKKEEPSFFSTFFPAGKKNEPKKKGVSVMDTPPPVIRPQAALSDRESMETEVISTFSLSFSFRQRLRLIFSFDRC
jgi:hypothetical protein